MSPQVGPNANLLIEVNWNGKKDRQDCGGVVHLEVRKGGGGGGQK